MSYTIAKLLDDPKKIFLLLLTVDIILLIVHIFLGRQINYFHLDFENNLPTIYQSSKLAIFGIVFFGVSLGGKIKKELKSFMFPLSIFIIFLGLDEYFQIHENIYRIFEFFPFLHPSKIVDASMRLGYRSSLWILYYLPGIILFFFWSGYWLRYFQSKMKNNFYPIMISSICLFTVLLSEVLSSTGTYSEIVYFALVTLEEFAEMIFATTLIFIGARIIKSAQI